MGLFNKLKNVLFEEEEIEIPVKEPEVKREVKPEVERKPLERKKPLVEEAIPDNTPIMNDQELFKAEKTFDFPMFDDQEFENMKSLVAEEKKEEPKKNMSMNLFDYEKPKIKREEIRSRTPEIRGRVHEPKKETTSALKKFTPSPVISPVYGVLDKNYKKEDIIVKKEEKKTIELDAVRKKAFGALEDDLEKSLREEKESRVKFDSDEKMDELLKEAVSDTIEVPEIREPERETVPRRNERTEKLEPLDKPRNKTPMEKVEEEDTLENDLFDLIDSMYENKEEE